MGPAEQLVSHQRGLEVRTHDGECLWRTRVGALSGDDCPYRPLTDFPTPQNMIVADLEQDGEPEILVASSGANNAAVSRITAFRRDGSILWRWAPVVNDVPFNANDLAAFDFDGDGTTEVVVSGFPNSASEVAGVVFLDGRTGTPRLTLPANDKEPAPA